VNSRFSVKLRREIAANPKKAGVLALLLIVAIWFWAPLLGKWFGKPETDVKDGTPTQNSAFASPAAGGGVGASSHSATESAISVKGKLPHRPWRQLVTWIEQDPRMSPATELAIGRDPFKLLPIEAMEKKRAEPASEQQPDLTPTLAGLVLTTTIVGRGQSIALIGGEAYKEGSVVAALRGDGRFRIVEIRPREVILERKGKLYNLSLPTNEWATRR
jgi:hypothetical protein